MEGLMLPGLASLVSVEVRDTRSVVLMLMLPLPCLVLWFVVRNDCFWGSVFGKLGTGGASCGTGAGLRPGEGDLKVRSVIELALGDLWSCFPWRDRSGLLVREALLLRARFDWTSATLVGVVGRALRAAAAAADDNEFEGSLRMKAEAAAVAAFGFAVSLVRG